ncbi:MAG: ABC transporter substrate-binding protein [Actinomycetota bacterium]
MPRTCLTSVLTLSALLLAACSPEPAPSPTTDMPVATSAITSTSAASTTQPQSTTTDTGPAPQGTLHVGTTAVLDSLDPADAVDLPDWEMILAMAEGLLVREPESGELTPGVAAEEPQVSDDGLTYTFRLESGVRFSDGLELTAPLYADSVERVMTLNGRASDMVNGFVDRVEAVDDSTLAFHLHRPFAFFPVLLSGAAYVPTHPDIYSSEQIEPRPPPPLHGVGDWYIAELDEDQAVLRANPESQAGPSIESVVIHYYATSEELTAAMTSGDVDLAWRGVGPEMVSALEPMEEVTVATAPGGVLQFLTLNHQRPPTDDPLVRRAIATVVDRQAVASRILNESVSPAYSPIPPGFLGSAGVFRDAYGEPDPAEATELLTEAGYTPEEPAQLELAYPPERYGLQVAEAVGELERQLESTGLIDVTLTAQAWNTYVGEVVAGSYNAAFLGWVFDFPDPHNYLAPFLLQGGLGGSGAGPAEEVDPMVALLEEAAVEGDNDLRGALYVELQEMYAEDVVTLPLWIDPEAVAYWDHVSADPEGPDPEALNIGADLRLDYSSLRLDR